MCRTELAVSDGGGGLLGVRGEKRSSEYFPPPPSPHLQIDTLITDSKKAQADNMAHFLLQEVARKTRNNILWL